MLRIAVLVSLVVMWFGGVAQAAPLSTHSSPRIVRHALADGGGLFIVTGAQGTTVGQGGAYFTRQMTEGAKFGPITPVPPNGIMVRDPIATQHADGRVVLLAIGAGDGEVYFNESLVCKTQPCTFGFAGWRQLPPLPHGARQVAASLSRAGLIQVAVVTNDGNLFATTQSAPSLASWPAWSPVNTASPTMAIALAENAKGTSEMFTVRASSGDVRTYRKTSTGWESAANLGGVVRGTPSIVRRHDGRLQIFVASTAAATLGSLCTNVQQAAESFTWSGWSCTSHPMQLGVSAVVEPDDRVRVAGIDLLNRAWTRKTTSASQLTWSALTGINGSFLQTPIAFDDVNGVRGLGGVGTDRNMYLAYGEQAAFVALGGSGVLDRDRDPVHNGHFQSNTLNYWEARGSVATIADSTRNVVRLGSGNDTPTPPTVDSIAQTVTADELASRLSFEYAVDCTDRVVYDKFSVTMFDHTTGTTTTILPATCARTGWSSAGFDLPVGHAVTITFALHQDGRYPYSAARVAAIRLGPATSATSPRDPYVAGY